LVRRLFRVFVKTVLKFWPIFAAIVALVVWRFFPALQDKLRLWGVVLQLVGLAMVITGILETRARLGVGLADAARALLSRFKSEARVSGSADLRIGGAAVVVMGQGTVKPVVRAEAGAAMREEASERAAALEAEQRAREESDQEILKRLRGAGLIAIGIRAGCVLPAARHSHGATGCASAHNPNCRNLAYASIS
jgi:hypothetical protein